MSDDLYESDPTGFFAEGKHCGHIGNFDVSDHPEYNDDDVDTLEFRGVCEACNAPRTFILLGNNVVKEPDF